MSSSQGCLYFVAVLSLFTTIFLLIISFLLLNNSESIEIDGDKSDKVKSSFICAGINFSFFVLSSLCIFRNIRRSERCKNKNNQ
ncbi:conserved protein, unknown function [Hepatocystis sp. ex Piliocolobus tephrosceles]|nr:conserved protein, unknown function [Hepatocystis sp. ex Piliocolobus tephrosceles]